MYKTMETAIKHLNEGMEFSRKTFDLLRDNKDVVLVAVEKSLQVYRDLDRISPRLQDDNDVVLLALKKSGFGEAPLKYASERIKQICNGMNQSESIEALTKAIESEKLHEQLQKEIKPKGLDFAKSLSAECKQATMEQSSQVAKARPRMKI